MPVGAVAMVVSCSRFAWEFNRTEVGTSLATLGATNVPTNMDDMYVLIGTKSPTAGVLLAEARTPCCLNPDPVCATCDQTPTTASVDVAGGTAVLSSVDDSLRALESGDGAAASKSAFPRLRKLELPAIINKIRNGSIANHLSQKSREPKWRVVILVNGQNRLMTTC